MRAQGRAPGRARGQAAARRRDGGAARGGAHRQVREGIQAAGEEYVDGAGAGRVLPARAPVAGQEQHELLRRRGRRRGRHRKQNDARGVGRGLHAAALRAGPGRGRSVDESRGDSGGGADDAGRRIHGDERFGAVEEAEDREGVPHERRTGPGRRRLLGRDGCPGERRDAPRGRGTLGGRPAPRGGRPVVLDRRGVR